MHKIIQEQKYSEAAARIRPGRKHAAWTQEIDHTLEQRVVREGKLCGWL